MKLISLITVFAAVSVTISFANAEGEPSPQIPAVWTTAGTGWVIHVRQYSMGWALGISDPQRRQEAQKPEVQCEFDMRVTVMQPRGEATERIARIQFTPSSDAPEILRGSVCVLELDATTGKVKTIKISGGGDKVGGNESVASFDSEQVLYTRNYGFPSDWIVSASDIAQIPQREEERRIAIEKKSILGETTGHFYQFIKKLRQAITDGDKVPALEIEAAHFYPLIEEAQDRVVQTWVPGEGWWRSFKRYIQGHINLEAELVIDRKEK